MKPETKGLLRALTIVSLLVVGAGLGLWRLGAASGQTATLSLSGAPASVSAGDNISVQISVADVTNLGAYEWQLAYDPDVVAFVNATPTEIDGGFLGLGVPCEGPVLPPSLDLQPGNVRFGCNRAGSDPGPNGGGLLSTVHFSVVVGGEPDIHLVCAGLADVLGDGIPIANVPDCAFTGATPTPGPADTATPVGADTATPAPGDTPTPVGPTPTPGGPTATATATPVATGPTATPTPLPPGFEAVDLAAGCNPVATTYADATPIGTIAAAVGPAGNLEALWEFEGTAWQGYSPAYPEASDLTAKNFLDVVFVCVTGPGAFVRPIV